MSRKVHFMCRNWQQAQDMELGILSPCWLRHFQYRGARWPSLLRTNDPTEVTCKRCIVALARCTEALLSAAQ